MGTPSHADDFQHQLAIKLSRALNIVNPNDLLAQRVTDIARTNTLDAFMKGLFSLIQRRPTIADMSAQPQGLSESSPIHFWQNCTPKYCCMLSKSPQVWPRIQCKASPFMTAMFLNLSLLDQAVLCARILYA